MPANTTLLNQSPHHLIKKHHRAVLHNSWTEDCGQLGDDAFQRLGLVHGHGFPAHKILSEPLDETRSEEDRRARTFM